MHKFQCCKTLHSFNFIDPSRYMYELK